MYPEDRVLVALMNQPQDLRTARDLGWYRVPTKKATRGVFFEYIAFYFTASFGEERWAVHYYARNLGHELLHRYELLPAEPDHPRATDLYYKLQLGPLRRRESPIVSLRWRRITFIHTTWDRFEAAREINDLFVEGDEFVDRLYHALREADLAPERHYPLREGDVDYVVDLAVLCREGVVGIECAPDVALPGGLVVDPDSVGGDELACLPVIQAEVERRGGVRPLRREEAGK
jgi:hypothetical protein